jgi:hypothetical protein
MYRNSIAGAILVLSLFTAEVAVSFRIHSNPKPHPAKLSSSLDMKWSFGKGMGSLNDLGLIGPEGEYYFHPQKPATLKGPSDIVGKSRVIPIFSYNNVVLPQGSEWLNVFEMKHRQLLNDVNVFGLCYYSQQQQKIALTGTLVKITSRKILEDGRVFAVIEGGERFYLEEVLTERPYIKARVRTFRDYSETPAILATLEAQIMNEVLCNLKYMEILFPARNYTMNSSILKYRPMMTPTGIRSIQLASSEAEIERSSKFSFAVAEMLQVSPSTRLLLLQETRLEKRFSRFLNVLEHGGEFLRSELLKKGLMTEEEILAVRNQVAERASDVDFASPGSGVSEDYMNGRWLQQPTFYD